MLNPIHLFSNIEFNLSLKFASFQRNALLVIKMQLTK